MKAKVLLASVSIASSLSVAQDLPKSGTIHIHTGWQATEKSFNLPEKNAIGSGTVIGTSFNDQGNGPLHGGPAICVFTFHFKESGELIDKGYCAFGDSDGDRIFTDWDGGQIPGKDEQGINRISGGTGKYKGITGQGPWMCWGNPTDPAQSGAHRCKQSFNYRLP